MKMVVYLFGLIDSKPVTTDRKKFEDKTVKIWLSMSRDGEISAIDVQEKMKDQILVHKIYQFQPENNYFPHFLFNF